MLLVIQKDLKFAAKEQRTDKLPQMFNCA